MVAVNQKFEKYCENCPYLEVITSVLSSMSGPEEVYIRCENQQKCQRLYERLKKEVTNEQ